MPTSRCDSTDFLQGIAFAVQFADAPAEMIWVEDVNWSVHSSASCYRSIYPPSGWILQASLSACRLTSHCCGSSLAFTKSRLFLFRRSGSTNPTLFHCHSPTAWMPLAMPCESCNRPMYRTSSTDRSVTVTRDEQLHPHITEGRGVLTVVFPDREPRVFPEPDGHANVHALREHSIDPPCVMHSSLLCLFLNPSPQIHPSSSRP